MFTGKGDKNIIPPKVDHGQSLQKGVRDFFNFVLIF